MTLFQKIAALVYRIASIALIIQSCFIVVISIWIGFRGIEAAIPSLVGGIILFFAAIPLARITTNGFED